MLRECFKDERLAKVVLEDESCVKTILGAAQARKFALAGLFIRIPFIRRTQSCGLLQ